MYKRSIFFVLSLVSLNQWAFAEGAPAAGPAPSLIGTLVPFALMFGVIYFLMIRPQQKKMKDQQSMINALKQGDHIVTQSGIFGTILELTDKVVTLEVAEKVKLKMLKSQVAGVVPKE